MLVLTRREGESIRIGRDIVVTIARMSHFRGRPECRVRIAAPKSVHIVRTELEGRDGDSSDGYGSHKGK